MNYLILLFLCLPVFGDVSLDQAYKREKTYLNAQKEALLKLKASMNSSLKQRKTRAEKDIAQKQDELSRLQLKNQELHEEFKALEKTTKESSQMSGQLEKNSLKILEGHSQLRAKLGLLSSTTAEKETDPVKKFEALLADSFDLLNVLSHGKWRPHAFLDEKEHLVQGEVYFMGLFSAWGKHKGKIYNLSPYNDEFLKAISEVKDGEMYLFTPNFERTGLKAPKSWKETVADAIPALVMMIIMAAVLGLFILLARA